LAKTSEILPELSAQIEHKSNTNWTRSKEFVCITSVLF